MENGWSLFNNHHHHNSSSSGSTSGTRGGHNGHCNNNLAWDIWDLGTSRFDWTNSFHEVHAPSSTTAAAAAPAAATTTTYQEASAVHALMLSRHHQQPPPQQQQQGMASLYAGGGSYYQPDPHLMCLKLGKRHYFEDATALGDRHVDDGLSVVAKRGRSPYHGGGGINVGPSGMTTSPASAGVTVASTAAVTVPRCQVEGCHVALVEAKEYHRRHKVCEMHAKAPKVVVLGLDQRFCQQCSRFHAVTEFDETKRSCRRRLAGHNERRRKGSTHDSIHPKNPAQGRAHSLLSSKNSSWFSSADLSSRCSAALHELIAENRAAILARQLVHDPTQPSPNNSLLTYHHHHHRLFSEPQGWDRFDHEGGGGHVTLDLMQAPSSAFGFLSVRGKSAGEDEEEEECSELWRSLGGAHIV